jgi:hypothetical protein
MRVGDSGVSTAYNLFADEAGKSEGRRITHTSEEDERGYTAPRPTCRRAAPGQPIGCYPVPWVTWDGLEPG